MGQDGGALNEREVARLLKRIDRMIPLEESEQRLMTSSKRVVYSRLVIAVLWVAVFSSLWTLAYYSMLSANSESLAYIIPRLSVSVGLIAVVVFMRMTDRLKLSWAMVIAVLIMVISRTIA